MSRIEQALVDYDNALSTEVSDFSINAKQVKC